MTLAAAHGNNETVVWVLYKVLTQMWPPLLDAQYMYTTTCTCSDVVSMSKLSTYMCMWVFDGSNPLTTIRVLWCPLVWKGR